MPNRILREGVISSKRMAKLVEIGGWEAEIFYRRLMSKVDDFGRFTADPLLLRTELYPRQLDLVREANVERFLNACVEARLVRLYSRGQRGTSIQEPGGPPRPFQDDHDDEVFLELLDFRQQTRAKASKYPSPDSKNVKQMNCICAADATHVRPYTDTDTDTEAQTARVRARDAPLNSAINAEIPVSADQRRAALQAFEQWSSIRPPVGRGYGLSEPNDEHRWVTEMLDVVAQEPPIIRGKELISQHLLVPQAVDILRNKGKSFKNPKYAVGCVKSELGDWARSGAPSHNGERFVDAPPRSKGRSAALAPGRIDK